MEELKDLVSRWEKEESTIGEVFEEIKNMDFVELMKTAEEDQRVLWILMLISLMFGFNHPEEFKTLKMMDTVNETLQDPFFHQEET